MATISFNESAPTLDGPVHFVFGNSDFDLEEGKSVDSDDAIVVAGALTHPWLSVQFPEIDVNVLSGYDPTDPHDNPAADHLSALASDETRAAAAQNEEAIMAIAYPNSGAATVAAEDAPTETQVAPAAPATDTTPNTSTPASAFTPSKSAAPVTSSAPGGSD